MRSLRVIGISLIACIVLLIATYFLKEGFKGDLWEEHKKMVDAKLQNYNPIGTALVSAGTQGNLGDSTRGLMGSPGNTDVIGGEASLNIVPLSTKKTGLFDIVETCEAVKSDDCSAFDNKKFAENCGICLDLGPSEGPALNSQNAASIGGRVLLPDDRKLAEDSVVGNFIPDYQPTLGTCPASKRMAANKAQCLRIKRQMACEKNANYDQKDCAQCFSEGTYSIADPSQTSNLFNGSGTLVLYGEGVLSYIETGYESGSKMVLSDSKGLRIPLNGREMTRVLLSIKPVEEDSPPPSIAGYLIGNTTNGEFTIDLSRIVLNDSVTGRKPLTGGSMNVEGNQLIKMIAGFGQKELILYAVSPFTFVDPYSQEGVTCPSSPYITKQASAEFMASDPCYKRGTGPGKYSLECLQNLFISNGGTDKGEGYPKDSGRASNLMMRSDGRARTLDEIANYVYAIAVISATGVNLSGDQQTIEEWSKASVFCTGNEITSPCDTVARDSGPLSDDCLTYLWDNMGSGKFVGGTYNKISMANSLFSKGDSTRFCQRSGTLSPTDSNGKKNSAAISYWKKQGGVSAVKAMMKSIHDGANAEGDMLDDERSIYINQCYGDVSLVPRPGPTVKTGKAPSCPSQGCGTMARYVRFWNNCGYIHISQMMIMDIYGNNLALNSTPRMGGGVYPGWGTTLAGTINGDTSSGCCGVIGDRPGCALIEYDLGKPYDIISVLFYQQPGRPQVGGRITLANISIWEAGGQTELAVEQITSDDTPLFFSFQNPNPDPKCMACIKDCPYPKAKGSDVVGLCGKSGAQVSKRVTDNGYTASGSFATHFPSSNQIILDSRLPKFSGKVATGFGSAAPDPAIGSLVTGPFVQDDTRVTRVIASGRMPSNPYVDGKTVVLNKSLVNIREDRGDVFTYTFSKGW